MQQKKLLEQFYLSEETKKEYGEQEGDTMERCLEGKPEK